MNYLDTYLQPIFSESRWYVVKHLCICNERLTLFVTPDIWVDCLKWFRDVNSPHFEAQPELMVPDDHIHWSERRNINDPLSVVFTSRKHDLFNCPVCNYTMDLQQIIESNNWFDPVDQETVND